LFSEKVRGAYNTANMSTSDDNQERMNELVDQYHSCAGVDQWQAANDISDSIKEIIVDSMPDPRDSVNEIGGDDDERK
jgi:hypothetical protein